jgi:hypothetical protein
MGAAGWMDYFDMISKPTGRNKEYLSDKIRPYII